MPHKEKHDIAAELKKIYTDAAGDLPDFSKIEKTSDKRTWKRLAFLFFVSGLLLSLLWGGFLILGRSNKSPDDLKISFRGPERLEPIKEYEFAIELENVSTMNLARATFELNLPDNFFLTSISPELDERRRLAIGTLKRNEKKEFTFRGYFLAKENETVSLSALVVYHPENFNATFESQGSFAGTITEGALVGSVEGPDKLLSGDEAEFVLSYGQKEGTVIENPAVSVLLPPGFVITTSTVQRLKGNIWPAAMMDREGRIKFKGIFSVDLRGEQEITFLLGVLKDNVFYATKEIKAPLELLGSELEIDAQLNGLSLKDFPDTSFVHFNDLIAAAVDIKSKSAAPLKNVRVVMHLEALPEVNGETIVDWASLVSSPAASLDTQTIVWTSRDVPSFKSFKENASEHLETNVRLRSAPFPVSLSNYHARFWIEVLMDGVGKIAKTRRFATKIVDLVLLSDADFVTEARYFSEEGVALSTGPLPPRVGEETTYRIMWKLQNSLHDLENVLLKAQLGERVTLTGKNLIPAGVFSFDSGTKTVSWNLNRWPKTLKNLEISFEVALRPEASDRGQTPLLIGATSLEAKDTAVGAGITLAAPELTTNISQDAFAIGKAVVQ